MSPYEQKSSGEYAIFKDLSPAEQQHVDELLQDEDYPQATTILREGKSTQCLWLIVRGRCQVLKTRKDGNEQQLATLEPGAVFGEMSFFHPAPHSASIRALDEVRVTRLSRESYVRLQETCPSAANRIALNIVSILAERLRRMDEWTREFVEKPEGERDREEWREFRSKLYSDWTF